MSNNTFKLISTEYMFALIFLYKSSMLTKAAFIWLKIQLNSDIVTYITI